MSCKLNQYDNKEIIFRFAKAFNQERDFLNELDSKIGDGDHGITMSRGFNAVSNYIHKNPDLSISSILTNGGLRFNEETGSTIGILIFSAMREASKTVEEKDLIDLKDLKNILLASIKAIQKRGKSSKGQKTILDTLIPVLDYLNDHMNKKDESIVIKEGMEIAFQAAESTKELESQIGRARWFKNRSIGVIDPGAYSGFLIVKTIGEYLLDKDSKIK